jgi:hypothetical protein
MKFERYVGFRDRKVSDTPVVTISKIGRLYLNIAASIYFKEEYVDLLWAKDERTIGIKPVSERRRGSLKLINQTSGLGITVTGFLKKNNISFTDTKRFHCKWDAECEGGMLLVDLNKEVEF